jgi:hypothetical protein
MGKLNKIEFSAVSTTMTAPNIPADSIVAKFTSHQQIDTITSTYIARYGEDVFQYPHQPEKPEWHITLRQDGQSPRELFLPIGLGVDALNLTRLACTEHLPRYLALVCMCWLSIGNQRHQFYFPLARRGVHRLTPHPSEMDLKTLAALVHVPSELKWTEIPSNNQPYYLRDAKAGKGALLEVHSHQPFVLWYWLSFADFNKSVDDSVVDRLSTAISQWRHSDLID